jgi:hypothetical protein
MAETIQFHSHVGDDGMLSLQVNLGAAEAKKEVIVTIEPVGPPASVPAALSWREFLDRTYGSCAGLGVERHDQGVFEQREPIV